MRSGERTEMELALKTLRGEIALDPSGQSADRSTLDGNVTRFIGVVHDITDRKVNEEVLRSQALAIEVMHEGVVLSDSGGIIRMTNPAFDRMFGIVAGSFIGKQPAASCPAIRRWTGASPNPPTKSRPAPARRW